MQAVRVFGSMELKAGMISDDVRQQNMQFWTQQVHREMSTGMVNQDVLEKLNQTGVLSGNKGGGSSDPTGDGPQPVGQPSPPPQAGSSAPPAAAPPATPPPGAAPGLSQPGAQ